jgi:hypothetical protein
MDRSVCVWSMPRESAESMTDLRTQQNQTGSQGPNAARSRAASIGTFRSLAAPPPAPDSAGTTDQSHALPTSTKVGRLADKVKQLRPPPPAPVDF